MLVIKGVIPFRTRDFTYNSTIELGACVAFGVQGGEGVADASAQESMVTGFICN